jgi:RHS repeat-associated protein
VTDALSQVKTYAYANDDRLSGITYTGAVNPTPNVSFTYDPYFPRLTAMTDGTGTRQYAYVPVGSPGALQLQQDSGPLPSSAITSAYDALGRLSQRTVQGAGTETFQYDAIGRLSVHTDDLGTFTLGYLGQTGQIASRQLASSTLATTWSYLPNTGDRRLAGIANTGLTAGQFSNFTYTTTPENFFTGITESSDAPSVYPAAASQTATYNNLNQLTNLSGQALAYDANGNLTSDGQRTYAWDAENRLVGIGYPGVSGKATAFTYDGLGRRATISSTPPGGGSATVTSYLWCGDDICQARDAGNNTLRSYYDEGEYLPGTPAQTLYYGIDQIGSVRRVFASTSSAPAYDYDPYGAPLRATAPTTDFVYAGMFYNADSGLYLTNYRAFDPVAGRWQSRDPFGESSDPLGNLYPYVRGNPVTGSDPSGLYDLSETFGKYLPNGEELACRVYHACAPPPPPNSCQKPDCPPGVVCMSNPSASGGKPALPGDPYNPAEVDKRRSKLRDELGAPSRDPDSPIPDQGPGYNVGGQPAKEGTPHDTGERNVNPNEEHSRRPKGNPSGTRY